MFQAFKTVFKILRYRRLKVLLEIREFSSKQFTNVARLSLMSQFQSLLKSHGFEIKRTVLRNVDFLLVFQFVQVHFFCKPLK